MTRSNSLPGSSILYKLIIFNIWVLFINFSAMSMKYFLTYLNVLILISVVLCILTELQFVSSSIIFNNLIQKLLVYIGLTCSSLLLQFCLCICVRVRIPVWLLTNCVRAAVCLCILFEHLRCYFSMMSPQTIRICAYH